MHNRVQNKNYIPPKMYCSTLRRTLYSILESKSENAKLFLLQLIVFISITIFMVANYADIIGYDTRDSPCN